MGLLSGRLLGIQLPQRHKRLFVFMETDGCAADGVSVATGCWVGRRTMRMVDFGKVAATFVDRDSGRAFRIHPHPESRQRAVDDRPDARSRWHAQREAYQTLPDQKLLVARPVALQVDLDLLISKPGVRVPCDVCGEEVINEREVHGQQRTICRACAGEAYYRPLASAVAVGAAAVGN